MLPVTGPFEKVVNRVIPSGPGAGSSQFYSRQFIMRQAAPYNLPLPYNATFIQVLSARASYGPYWTDTSWSEPFDSAVHTTAHNRAYANFVDGVGPSADLGTTFGEWGQARDMIQKRGGQLFDVIVAAKRGDFRGATTKLKYAFTDKQKTKAGASKTVADFWLETWFGWKPLISDIGNAVDVLCHDYKTIRIKGYGKAEKLRVYRDKIDMGGGSYQDIRYDWIHESRESIVGTVSVRNPNVGLPNQLGLVNAASVAWELVPWSFAVDWFLNVGQVIGSLSDLAGFKVTDVCTFTKRRIVENHSWLYHYRYVDGAGHPAVVNHTRSYSKRRTDCVRSLGYDGPTLQLLWPNWSLTRLATTGALLVQQLHGLKRP